MAPCEDVKDASIVLKVKTVFRSGKIKTSRSNAAENIYAVEEVLKLLDLLPMGKFEAFRLLKLSSQGSVP